MLRNLEESFNFAYGQQGLWLTRIIGDDTGVDDELVLLDKSDGKQARLPANKMEEVLKQVLKKSDISGLWSALVSNGAVLKWSNKK